MENRTCFKIYRQRGDMSLFQNKCIFINRWQFSENRTFLLVSTLLKFNTENLNYGSRAKAELISLSCLILA